MRSRLMALLVAALLSAVACTGAATPSPTPTASPSTSATPVPLPTSAPTPTATASPTPSAIGAWEDAGSLAIGRAAPHVVALSNGGALVVGNDEEGLPDATGAFVASGSCVRKDSRVAEILDPDARRWDTVDELDLSRSDFAAVPLADGRVLVTGGVGVFKGDDAARYWRRHTSFASTHIYDPTTEAWSRAADLSTRRTAPIAAVLQDGRVLVAGGLDLDAPTGPWTPSPGGLADPSPGIALAAYRPDTGEASRSAPSVLANVTPSGPDTPVLATAEIYDPATDTWSPTGPMRFARYGDAAVTLADGRVLVVPNASPWAMIGGFGWDRRNAAEHEVAGTMTELYDSRTGRFSLAGELPPPADWQGLTDEFDDSSWIPETSTGTLVALADGGALLAARTAILGPYYYVRTLRYDAAGGTWTEIDRGIWADRGGLLEEVFPGRARPGAVAARLADGRVLVAGGQRSTGVDGSGAIGSTDAVVYDPASGTWREIAPMPLARAGGAAVALSDRSVVMVGGLPDRARQEWWSEACGSGSTGIATSVRFVPGP